MQPKGSVSGFISTTTVAQSHSVALAMLLSKTDNKLGHGEEVGKVDSGSRGTTGFSTTFMIITMIYNHNS